MSQPNVLLICVDHWPGYLLGGAGHPAIMTPTLDQLAANGVRFTRAYSATPVCIPARRALMTGTTPATHGDRVFNETLEMDPALPTLAETFGAAGYQTYAVGKLHVYPQRDRIGFDDVILNEEGRHHLGPKADDYELFLAAEGYAGQEFTHGMPNNGYITRTWHLPEYTHPTNWTVAEMSRIIRRRDPKRPAFWYASFNFPHPPLVPLAEYRDLYRDVPIPDPVIGEWAHDVDALPLALRLRHNKWSYAHLGTDGTLRDFELRAVRRAFYAQCTHIDHQIRLLVGLLREEGLIDNTIIAFTSDHGDMLGDQRLYAKGVFYEQSAHVPLIVVPTADSTHLGHHQTDDRLVELRDIMPTLLDMAGIPIPKTVEGQSLAQPDRRDYLTGELWEDARATRMVCDERYKLIYYAVGNCVQLFDLADDPQECHDLAGDPAHATARDRLVTQMIAALRDTDREWVRDSALVGLPDRDFDPVPNRGLTAQRGWRFIG